MTVDYHECFHMRYLRGRGDRPKDIAQLYSVSVGTVYTHTNGGCSH